MKENGIWFLKDYYSTFIFLLEQKFQVLCSPENEMKTQLVDWKIGEKAESFNVLHIQPSKIPEKS